MNVNIYGILLSDNQPVVSINHTLIFPDGARRKYMGYHT